MTTQQQHISSNPNSCLFLISYITDTDIVGVYAIQLVLDGEPLIIYIDDYLPALDASLCNSSNRGIAMAYTPEMQYSWVSLLEKSFAKLYGNYAQLEVGHTWQVISSVVVVVVAVFVTKQ